MVFASLQFQWLQPLVNSPSKTSQKSATNIHHFTLQKKLTHIQEVYRTNIQWNWKILSLSLFQIKRNSVLIFVLQRNVFWTCLLASADKKPGECWIIMIWFNVKDKNEYEVFIRNLKNRERDESTTLKVKCFYCFEVFGTCDKNWSMSFLIWLLRLQCWNSVSWSVFEQIELVLISVFIGYQHTCTWSNWYNLIGVISS